MKHPISFRLSRTLFFLAALIALIVAPAAWAVPIAVVNPGFEEPDGITPIPSFPPGGSFPLIPGWAPVVPCDDCLSGIDEWSVPQATFGGYALRLGDSAEPDPPIALTTGHMIAAGASYTLGFWAMDALLMVALPMNRPGSG